MVNEYLVKRADAGSTAAAFHVAHTCTLTFTLRSRSLQTSRRRLARKCVAANVMKRNTCNVRVGSHKTRLSKVDLNV